LPLISAFQIPNPENKAKNIQSNEGDTPKNAYSFRGGNWLRSARGSVAMSWGSEPTMAELFPGLWEYYVNTAKDTDQFFSATGGAGYAYPWALPTPEKYFAKAAQLNADYMPADQWIDVWEGACPQPAAGVAGSSAAGGMNPCLPMYEAFRKTSLQTAGGKGAVGGFSQQPTLKNNSAFPHYVSTATIFLFG
jgi:hypothetical protein